MPVSCACGYDDHEWYYYSPTEFEPLKTKRRRRCFACRVLIDIGADCGAAPRYRGPKSEIEESIHGDEVPMATAYLCEKCTGLLWAVEEAGGCVTLMKGEPIKEAVAEWKADYPDGCLSPTPSPAQEAP